MFENKEDEYTMFEIFKIVMSNHLSGYAQLVRLTLSIISSCGAVALNISSIFIFDRLTRTLENQDPNQQNLDVAILTGYMLMLLEADLCKALSGFFLKEASAEVACNLAIDVVVEANSISSEDRIQLGQETFEYDQFQTIYNQTNKFLLNFFTNIPPSVIQLVGISIVITTLYDLTISLNIWLTSFVYFITSWAGSRYINEAHERLKAEIRKDCSSTNESLSFYRTIKMYTGEQHETEKVKAAQQRIKALRINEDNRSDIIDGVLQFILKVSQYLFLFVTGSKTASPNEPTFTINDFIVLNVYYQLLLGPLAQISKNYLELKEASSDFNLIKKLLQNKEARSQAEHNFIPLPALDVTKGRSIVFEDVSFRYPTEGKDVICKCSLNIKPGEIIGIVGKSGIGKTTLVNLILGLFNNYDGKIKIDGIELKNVDRESLHKNIALISQHTDIFHQSAIKGLDPLSYNVIYGTVNRLELDANELHFIKENVTNVLEQVQLVKLGRKYNHPVRRIAKQEEQEDLQIISESDAFEEESRATSYQTSDTMLVTKASELKKFPEDALAMDTLQSNDMSGGEKQRIGIARVLYRGEMEENASRPTIYIFDEPTANLDANIEFEILTHLQKLTGNATVLIISHRIGLLESCDRVLFFDDSDSAKKQNSRYVLASHNELLSSNNNYVQSLLHFHFGSETSAAGSAEPSTTHLEEKLQEIQQLEASLLQQKKELLRLQEGLYEIEKKKRKDEVFVKKEHLYPLASNIHNYGRLWLKQSTELYQGFWRRQIKPQIPASAKAHAGISPSLQIKP